MPGAGRPLLLEEVVEPPPGVLGADGAGRGLALHGHAQRERCAVVQLLLVRDSRGDRFRALEALTRIEVSALAAGVKRGAAARTFGERLGGDRQGRATRRAAREAAVLEDGTAA